MFSEGRYALTPVIDNYPQLVNIEVEAGHVEIVGNRESRRASCWRYCNSKVR